jgi:hypothetical protein
MRAVRSAHAVLGPWRRLDLTRVGEKSRSGVAGSVGLLGRHALLRRPTRPVFSPGRKEDLAARSRGCSRSSSRPPAHPPARPQRPDPTRPRLLEHVRPTRDRHRSAVPIRRPTAPISPRTSIENSNASTTPPAPNSSTSSTPCCPRPRDHPDFRTPGGAPDSTSCNNAESTRPPCHCDGPAERWSMIGQAGTPGSEALPSHNRSAARVSNCIMSIQISSRGNATLPAADSASLSACPPVTLAAARARHPGWRR